MVAALSYITYIKSAFSLIRLAIRSTPSLVWEKAFIVMRYVRNLAVLSNYRTQPRLIPAPNYAPVARRCNRRRLAKPDQGGKQEANGGKLAFIRAVQAFSCHGGGWPAPLPVLSAWLLRHMQPSLVLSWAPRKYRIPPSPPANLGCLLPRIAVT